MQFNFNCKTLFLKIKNIEHEMGRNFYVPRNYPRIIDIDILTFNDETINNNMFRVPHTKLSKRKFVLIPWNEISSNYEVPELNKNISILLNDVKDLSIIRKLKNLNRELKTQPKNLNIIAPEINIPEGLRELITIVEFPLLFSQ